MVPLGLGFGDFVIAFELTKEIAQNIKSAPEQFKSAEQTLRTTERLLATIQDEVASETSVFKRSDNQAEHLRNLMQSCQRPLIKLRDALQKVDSLGSSNVKPLDRIKLSRRGVSEIRGEIALRNDEICHFLQSIGVAGIGRLENGMDSIGRGLDSIESEMGSMKTQILEAIDKVVVGARLNKKNASYLTEYSNDDRLVWKQFRRDLINNGFRSADIERHKESISQKLTELRQEGMLDWDASTADNASEYTVAYIAHERANYRPPTASTVYADSVIDDSATVDKAGYDDDSSDHSTTMPALYWLNERSWKGREGSINQIGRLSRASEEHIFIINSDEEEVEIPVSVLSDEELDYVTSWRKAKIDLDAADTWSRANTNDINESATLRKRRYEAADDRPDLRSDALDHPDYDTEILRGKRSVIDPTWHYRRSGDVKDTPTRYRYPDLYCDALPHAASSGDIDNVRRLLRAGYNIEAIGRLSYDYETTNGYGSTVKKRKELPETTALYRAADGGHFETAHLLLRYGADANTKGKDGSSLLRRLVTTADSRLVRLILEYGAQVDTNGSLRLAARNGRLATAGILLDFGAKINALSTKGETALYNACCNDHHRVAELLLSEGANHRIVTDDGQSALYKAAGHGYHRVVRILLRYGADPAVGMGKTGETALYKASHMGHQKSVELLLRRHADPNTENEYRKINYFPERTEIFLQILRPAEARPEAGFRPLHAAAHIGHVGIARLLLAYGADVNARPKDGNKTAVYLAAEMRHAEMVKLLFDHGAQYLDQRFVDPVARFMSGDDGEDVNTFERDPVPSTGNEMPWLSKLRKESLAENGDGLRTLGKAWNRAKSDGTVSKVLVDGLIAATDSSRRTNAGGFLPNTRDVLSKAINTWSAKT